MTEPLVAARRLGVVFFPAFDWAISATHPEREERLLYTRDQLQEEGLSTFRASPNTGLLLPPTPNWRASTSACPRWAR